MMRPRTKAFRIYKEQTDVGKRVKQSKKLVRWLFCFEDGKEHEVQLRHSLMSGKKEITMDGAEIRSANESSQNTRLSWRYNNTDLEVQMRQGPEVMLYVLLIDGEAFENLQMRSAATMSAGSFSSSTDALRQRQISDDERIARALQAEYDASAAAAGTTAPPQQGGSGRFDGLDFSTPAAPAPTAAPAASPAAAPAFAAFGDGPEDAFGSGAAAAGFDAFGDLPAEQQAPAPAPAPAPAADPFDFGAAPVVSAPAKDAFGAASALEQLSGLTLDPVPTASPPAAAAEAPAVAPAAAPAPAAAAAPAQAQGAEGGGKWNTLDGVVNIDDIMSAATSPSAASGPAPRTLRQLQQEQMRSPPSLVSPTMAMQMPVVSPGARGLARANTAPMAFPLAGAMGAPAGARVSPGTGAGMPPQMGAPRVSVSAALNAARVAEMPRFMSAAGSPRAPMQAVTAPARAQTGTIDIDPFA